MYIKIVLKLCFETNNLDKMIILTDKVMDNGFEMVFFSEK